MHDLEISWRDGRARFGPDDSPIVVGRSSSSSVIVTDGIVSRRHVIFTWTGASWRAEDVSTHGCYDPIGVRLSPVWIVGTDTVFRLGGPEGPEMSVRLITRALAERLARAGIYDDPESPPTMIDFGPPPPPSGDGTGRSTADDIDLRQAEPEPGAPHPLDGPADQPRSDPDREPVASIPRSGGGSSGEPEDVGGGSNTAVGAESRYQWPAPSADDARSEAVIDLRSEEQDAPWSPEQGHDYRGPRAQPASMPHSKDDRPVASDRSEPMVSGPAATMVESDTLRLSIDGDDHVLLPGHEVTVGRDPRCTVHVDERHTLVSRNHLVFRHSHGGWWLEDTSSKGSYIDRRRVTGPYRVEGAFIVQMGDQQAGTPLRVVAAGTHKPPRNIAGIAIAAAAASALILVSLLAWLMFRGDATEAEQLERAKRATVMLLGDTGQGSGFFVTDSLIVTNQHVAGLADQLVVAVSEEADEPAQIRYVANLVENHPYLDLAVVRVANRAEINAEGSVTIGDAVEGSVQPPLIIGDSSTVTIGDPIYSTGFPGRLSISSADDEGNLRLSPVATTRGEAENLAIWPGCSNPDFADFIPADAPATVTCSADGDIDDAVLIASFTSGEGASGSPVVADGEVVAVVFAGSDTGSDVSRSITTDAFAGWLSSVVAANE